ncbi:MULTISPECIES: hypothetical protein [Nocardiaceae]|uniref:hypothetical protein n=1 Tax=Nocardiaceae TaxID=85025 RepID=UPI00070DD775|nr:MULTISPECIES: hypothetical protein [Rhodococcus]KQU35672.1 hypothetical protein ASH04_23650 [Rhodococcus sp. Leaf233]MBP2527509.1 hypothetical protein [Rhodococcus sp. PvP104]WQH31279.1 hypothetical protein U2G91_26095 [Rhodococcus fascians]
MNVLNLANTANAKTDMRRLRSQLISNYTREDAERFLHAVRNFRIQRAITLKYVLAFSCGIFAAAAVANANKLLTGRHPSILLVLALGVAALAVAVSAHTMWRNRRDGRFENTLIAGDRELRTTDDEGNP